MDELLLNLRDIQAPPPPGPWPLAPGWWIIIVILGLATGYWTIRRYRQRQGYFLLARAELDRLAKKYFVDRDHQSLVLGLSMWIRQVALLAYPRRQIGGLTGEAWVQFLDEPLGGREFLRGPGYIFAGEVYAARVQVDADRLVQVCRTWLNAVKPQLVRECSA